MPETTPVTTTPVIIRTVPWNGDFSEREREKAARVNEQILERPRYNQKQMFAEEVFQRRIELAKSRRREGFVWLVDRVRMGKIDLLQKGRLTGVEREANLLFAGSSAWTLPAKDVKVLGCYKEQKK